MFLLMMIPPAALSVLRRSVDFPVRTLDRQDAVAEHVQIPRLVDEAFLDLRRLVLRAPPQLAHDGHAEGARLLFDVFPFGHFPQHPFSVLPDRRRGPSIFSQFDLLYHTMRQT